MAGTNNISDYIRMGGTNLDTFHDQHLVPTKSEKRGEGKAIDDFVTFLKEQFSYKDYTVDEVRKSGSLGKGTAVRGNVDIDLVVFFNGIQKMQMFKKIRPKLLIKLKTSIANFTPWFGRLAFVKRTKFSLSYVLDGQEVDILPAFDVLDVYGIPKAYENHAPSPNKATTAQGYSASLAPLQIEFVKGGSGDDDDVDESVKRVIRLAKHWKKVNHLNIRSYTLELITIHAARELGHTVPTETLFKKVMGMLANADNLRVVFRDNYNIADYDGPPPTPYVLDPANPYQNTLARSDTGAVARTAGELMTLLRRL